MSRVPIPRDLVAASATALVLAILAQGDSYGYEIITTVKRLSGSALQWTDGMLYPVLHRLESSGFVKSYWSVAESGRKRKYYRLLDPGRNELNRLRAHWESVDATLRRAWKAGGSHEG